MKRPKPKDYQPKDFINGKYEDALEKYITYLEAVIVKSTNQLRNYLRTKSNT